MSKEACRRCGAPVEPGAKYCGGCGARVGRAEVGGLAGAPLRRRLALFAVVLLAISAATGAIYAVGTYSSGDTTQGLRGFTSGAGVSFGYPSSWHQSGAPGAIAAFSSPDGTSFVELFSNGNSSSTTVAQVLEQLYAETGAPPGQFYRFTKATTVNVGGTQAAVLAITFGDSGDVMAAFNAGQDYFSVVCGATGGRFYAMLGTCDAIISTIAVS